MSKDEIVDGKKKRQLKADITPPTHSDAKKIKADVNIKVIAVALNKLIMIDCRFSKLRPTYYR